MALPRVHIYYTPTMPVALRYIVTLYKLSHTLSSLYGLVYIFTLYSHPPPPLYRCVSIYPALSSRYSKYHSFPLPPPITVHKRARARISPYFSLSLHPSWEPRARALATIWPCPAGPSAPCAYVLRRKLNRPETSCRVRKCKQTLQCVGRWRV